MSDLRMTAAPRARLWRVGFTPAPWAWPGWEYATDGRFSGRWDDSAGNFRTVYAGESLLACLLEVLAALRPDPQILDELGMVDEDPEDAAHHPTAPAGQVPYSWLDPRAAGSAVLIGDYCEVIHSESVAALRPRFIASALRLGRQDFDAAALKNPGLRPLTQAVATHLYATGVAGVRFASRHGDELCLWAIFERPGDPEVSPRISDPQVHALTPDHPDLAQAMGRHGLKWLR